MSANSECLSQRWKCTLAIEQFNDTTLAAEVLCADLIVAGTGPVDAAIRYSVFGEDGLA